MARSLRLGRGSARVALFIVVPGDGCLVLVPTRCGSQRGYGVIRRRLDVVASASVAFASRQYGHHTRSTTARWHLFELGVFGHLAARTLLRAQRAVHCRCGRGRLLFIAAAGDASKGIKSIVFVHFARGRSGHAQRPDSACNTVCGPIRCGRAVGGARRASVTSSVTADRYTLYTAATAHTHLHQTPHTILRDAPIALRLPTPATFRHMDTIRLDSVRPNTSCPLNTCTSHLV